MSEKRGKGNFLANGLYGYILELKLGSGCKKGKGGGREKTPFVSKFPPVKI